MQIFETERLAIRMLKESDDDGFYDMMGNPNVMSMLPQPVMTRVGSDQHLMNFIETDQNLSETKVWAIELKDESEFIGICAFLKNDEKQDEIGYRLREKYWKKGYGTEIAKGLLEFGFGVLNMAKITADVAAQNLNSNKILEKFMSLKMEFYNKTDDCMDRRYEVLYENWQSSTGKNS